jgi:CDP-4-dehydro-6-deoxyglucose reductase
MSTLDYFSLNNLEIRIGEGTLLDNILDNGLLIEHSCRDGRCRNCVLSVSEGKEEVLACQTMPKAGVAYESKQLRKSQLPKSMNFPVKFVSINRVGNFYEVKFKYSSVQKLSYLPGQYFELIFEGFSRSYSIYEVDHSLHEISILIVPKDSGRATSVLFAEENLNSIFRINFPKGSFSLNDEDKAQPIFICTGTGIAPVLNMLANRDDIKIISKIYWGVRSRCEYTERIQSQFSEQVEIYFSQEISDQHGRNMRLPLSQIIKKQEKERSWYVCGNAEMISNFEQELAISKRAKDTVFKDPFNY